MKLLSIRVIAGILISIAPITVAAETSSESDSSKEQSDAHTKQQEAILKALKNLIATKEAAVWQELKAFDIQEEDVQAYYTDWSTTMRARYSPSSTLQLEPALEEKVRTFHAQASFKQELRGVRALPNIPAPATICLGYLYVNPQKFSALKHAEQALVILHLLATDHFDDAIVLTIIENLAKIDRDTVTYDHPLAKLCRLMQLRAALVACMQLENGPATYAQLVQEKLDRHERVQGALHPSHQESLQLALDIQKYLKNQA